MKTSFRHNTAKVLTQEIELQDSPSQPLGHGYTVFLTYNCNIVYEGHPMVDLISWRLVFYRQP